MRVNLICTCLNPAMVESSLLVFKTIRVGFPTAEIVVYANNLPAPVLKRLIEFGHQVLTIRETISHDHWCEALINLAVEPFWIADTDVVFFDSVEDFKCPMFGGRFEPTFSEEWTNSFHVARLHPSLMYIDPVAIRCAIRQWRSEHIPGYFPNAIASLVRQQFIPSNGQTLFYDTMAGLHHAFSGTPFSDDFNARFEHLFAGTYADTISAETKTLTGLVDLHRRVCDNPSVAKGIQSGQLEYYQSRNGIAHAIPANAN